MIQSQIIAAPNQKRVRVSCDGLPDGFSLDAWWDGVDWNGHVTPLFERAAGLALCVAMPAEFAYDTSRNAFRYFDIHADDPVAIWVSPRIFNIGGHVVELFLLGDSWCWSLEEGDVTRAISDCLSDLKRKCPEREFYITTRDDGVAPPQPRIAFDCDDIEIINPLVGTPVWVEVDPVSAYGIAREDAQRIARINGLLSAS